MLSILLAIALAQPATPPQGNTVGQSQTVSNQSSAQPDGEKNSAEAPAALPNAPTGNAADKPKSDQGNTDSKGGRWSLSDKIAAGATVAGFLQFLALIATIWIMILNGRRQLRAQMFPDDISIGDGTFLTPPEPQRTDVPGVVMIIKNSGQTPAYEVISWWEIKVIPPAQESSLLTPTLEKKHSTTVGAGCTFNKGMWFDRALTQAEKDEIFNGTLGIYAHGRIEYRDAFKIRHFSNFRLVYTRKRFPAKGAVMSFCEQGNEAN